MNARITCSFITIATVLTSLACSEHTPPQPPTLDDPAMTVTAVYRYEPGPDRSASPEQIVNDLHVVLAAHAWPWRVRHLDNNRIELTMPLASDAPGEEDKAIKMAHELLQPAVFALRIVAQPGEDGMTPERVAELVKVAPQLPANENNWRWLPIDDPQQFYSHSDDAAARLEALTEKDAPAYFAQRGMVGTRRDDSFYLLVSDSADGSFLAGRDGQLKDADRTKDQLGFPAIELTLDSQGGRRLMSVTGKNIRRPLALIIDDRILSAPIINDQLSTQIIITGNYTEREVSFLRRRLKATYFPVDFDESPESVKVIRHGQKVGDASTTR